MPVRIRFARHGHRKNPIFHLVAINSRRPRNGKPLELLGVYDPIPRVRDTLPPPPAANVFAKGTEELIKKEKKAELNVERIKWWLGVGAEPTRSVVKLLERGGVLTTPHKWQHMWSPPPPEAGQSLPSATPSAETSS
ncbi:ribosomal protein S16 [Cryptococcus amylolentus CBS 6039]|uniref:Ribosomal protein S16 n=2 Tax=Cryptococcus amylolentus TaxID=104669 RepID=A0A1E3HI22_9TREE|nr:ribosomal protein S16 [Cryptococcus amylolentus CBS 6039]ODN75988.1 ribosomal protein S16 [Cryptococcus amylolentus CBS 6039]ODN97110.1 ribosomal protein S16 [Cryptococcus amylolentus CBS 6273]